MDNVPEITDVDMPERLVEEIERLKKLHEQGVTTNRNIKESVEFRNPYLLEKIMKVFDIDAYCSNYDKNIYDPSIYEALANEPLDPSTLNKKKVKKRQKSGWNNND